MASYPHSASEAVQRPDLNAWQPDSVPLGLGLFWPERQNNRRRWSAADMNPRQRGIGCSLFRLSFPADVYSANSRPNIRQNR